MDAESVEKQIHEAFERAKLERQIIKEFGGKE